MADQVLLLGKTIQVSVQPGAEGVVDKVLPVLQGAAAVLSAQNGAGLLSPTQVAYIGALNGLGVALERSFTPCEGTADQADGEYVFFIGAADVAINPDPNWYASTIIHDGGHAWLSQHGQPAVGVQVEQTLTQVQIDYYNKVGAPAGYIADLQDYIDDTDAILARINQPVDATTASV